MHWEDEFRDKVVIVTGGTRGIGREIAAEFLGFGATVVVGALGLTDSEMDDIRSVGKAPSGSARLHGVRVDVADVNQVGAFAAGVVAQHGRIDILVNNAGTNRPGPALDVTEDDWDAILNTNLKGLFFLSQACAKHMVQRHEGTIVNIGSNMGLVAQANRAPYCASKGGVVNLTRALAVEWASRGIRVNSVAPAIIRTPLSADLFREDGFEEYMLDRIPLGRIGTPKDVVSATVFLASEAASWITGQTIAVDGGWTAQ